MEDKEERPYEVLLTDTAKSSYGRIKSKKDSRRVDKVLNVLDTVPEIGRLYDPVYDAAKPPFDVRVVYAGHFGIYYRVLEDEAQVHIYYIEDQRRDPMERFSHPD